MEFKITAAEALEMAKLEQDAGSDISAGRDWGIHLDRLLESALDTSALPEILQQHSKWVEILSEQFGSMMSPQEIEEVATSFQSQIQARLAGKIDG